MIVLAATLDFAQALPFAERIGVLSVRPATLDADHWVPQEAAADPLRPLRHDQLCPVPFLAADGGADTNDARQQAKGLTHREQVGGCP